MTIHAIQLTSHEEKYSPPERVLDVSVVGGVAFLGICEYDETYTDVMMTERNSIGVNLRELFCALKLLYENDKGKHS